ncbi:unnamed protein product, partial [Sphagnum troendelagicum]
QRTKIMQEDRDCFPNSSCQNLSPHCKNISPSYVPDSSSFCNPVHQSEPNSRQSSRRAKISTNKHARSPSKSREIECLHSPFSMNAQP